MALITRTIASYEGGLVEASFTYDDATMRLVSVRCANNHATNTLRAVVTKTTPPRTSLALEFPPGTDQTWEVPSGVANRIPVTQPDPRRPALISGVSIAFQYPYAP